MNAPESNSSQNKFESPKTAPTSLGKGGYLTAPMQIETMPPGVPYIIGNEAAERFCFYGMRTILVIFMTKYLLDWHGNAAYMSGDQAKETYHWFVSGVYFFPILGAIVADALLGKFRTIFSLSLVYCCGSFALAFDQSRLGLYLGLTLIAIGSGGIKSCVSANVGDQFGQKNKHLLEKVFGWFYFSINFGSFFSTLLTPILLTNYGPKIAFGVPGALMATATFIFWLGRKKFVHIPVKGSHFFEEALSKEGIDVLVRLGVIFLGFIAMFWALYEQTGAAWVLQAEKMNRQWLDFGWIQAFEGKLVEAGYGSFAGMSKWEIQSSQVQAINPLLIMLLIPVFTYLIYPGINKIFRLTPLRKVGIGLFLAVAAFSVTAIIQAWIDHEATPSIYWQFIPFLLITLAEVMVSITCLEFAYTQAPRKMKSLVMGLYLFSNSMGNAFTALVNRFIQNADGTSKLSGANYYWFFTVLMLIVTLLFVVVAAFYKEKTYIQEAAEE